MTRRAFLAGHPVRHSRSPIIHGYWLRQHGLDGSYEVVDILPADFPSFLRTFSDRGFVGGNVTIPHKEAAFQTVGRVTERARRIGAVNTVFMDGERTVGDNTDAVGFLSHLDQTFGLQWMETARTALVLGAGGAARAIAAGLADRGLERVWIVNRTLDRAIGLAQDLGSATVEAAAWSSLGGLLPRTDLLVNATSLGMAGQAPLEIALDRLKPGAIVTDAVYVPLETPLLAAARRRGHPIADGLGMLLHQAVPGFAYWFGVTPQVDDELRALIVADLPS
jgi:shikimate dehydrogenase